MFEALLAPFESIFRTAQPVLHNLKCEPLFNYTSAINEGVWNERI